MPKKGGQQPATSGQQPKKGGQTPQRSTEIMAPVGSWESLQAAFQAGAEAVYFGVGQLNMRSHSANHFSLDDLRQITALCKAHGVRAYLTVNTIIYGEDMEPMRHIIDLAKEAGVDAVIASDVAVMMYARQKGVSVHLSTQLNISNTEALSFYAQFADVVVLARELSLEQVKAIHEAIEKEQIKGPAGELVRIEMFCHGALCMAVSGKCYLSLMNTGRSANRGACMQLCRRGYRVEDLETGTELLVDNKYIMSPKDLKTVRFIDQMLEAGVTVFKIEGRARSAEYVYNVVKCYKEAISAAREGTFTEEKKQDWDERLAKVFNRGFWDGYYQGQTLGEWNQNYGSSATERRVYVGKGVKWFSRLSVGEFQVEACGIQVGDRLLIEGPTTGVMYLDCKEIRLDEKPVTEAHQGDRISLPVEGKIRPSDKLFKIVKA